MFKSFPQFPVQSPPKLFFFLCSIPDRISEVKHKVGSRSLGEGSSSKNKRAIRERVKHSSPSPTYQLKITPFPY